MTRLVVGPAIVCSLLAACGGPTETPPAPTQVAEDAAAARTGTATSSDGLEIPYTVLGEGSPAVVFIHGWMCDQGYWAAQRPGFAAHHRVITLDLPGHGRAGLDRELWTLPAFGDDVRAVADELGLDSMVLVGHSMGGPVALEAARLMPERVAGVVGVDTFHDLDADLDRERWNAMLAGYEQDFVGTCAAFVTPMFPEGADPDLVARIRDDMCAGPAAVGTTLLRTFGDYDQATAAARVGAPIRCVNSDMWPTDVEGNRAHAPGFDAVILEDTGHFVMVEEPERFNQALEGVIEGLLSERPETGGNTADAQ